VETPTSTGTDPIVPNPETCAIDSNGIHLQDEVVLVAILDPTKSAMCHAQPATTNESARLSGASTVTTLSVSTAAPTPTPTPTATPTPTSAPSSSPSASPKPVVAPAPSGGLPWWVWLLIAVGILVLVGIGIVIFRVRT
jgi:hypothetical protein